MKTKSIIILFSIGLATIISCTTTKKTTVDTGLTPQIEKAISGEITFNNQIKPIIVKFCGGTQCHHGSPSYWSTYKNIKKIVDNGELKEEVIVERSMPVNKNLPDLEYHTIKKWIETGAKE